MRHASSGFILGNWPILIWRDFCAAPSHFDAYHVFDPDVMQRRSPR